MINKIIKFKKSKKRKIRQFKDDNMIRVIKIPRSGIEELLWEYFMDHGEEILDIEKNSDHVIFHMTLDPDFTELAFYACNISEDYAPNFDKFDNYINKHVGFTTNSLFQQPDRIKRYISICVE